MRNQLFGNYTIGGENIMKMSSPFMRLSDANFTQCAPSLNGPDFSIVVSPSAKKRLVDANGDYNIMVVKDSGETLPLEFKYRGDKIFYLLTLLCQKATGGLPTKFFSFGSSREVIKNVYDEVFRGGGDEWVEKIAGNSHKLSVCRSHAKEAIDKNPLLDWNTAYWCSLETMSLFVGPKGKKLQVRRVMLPKERIIINDDNRLTQWLEGLPSLEEVVGSALLN